MHRAARRMAAALTGQLIVHSDFRVPRSATADLSGQLVTGFVARGKHMLLRTDGGWTVHTHFRMQGSWSVLGPGRRLPRARAGAARLLLSLADGRTAVALDMPVVDLLRTADETDVVGHLGPDLLLPSGTPGGWDESGALRRLAGWPERPAVSALLDQRNLAGLGNLWVGELLFLRGAWPWAPVGSLDLPGTLRLAHRLLAHGLANPGMVTTGDRRPGATHWVYGRAGRPCRRCGTPVAFRAGSGVGPDALRETWWCPSCQPAPAGATVPPVAAGPGPAPVRDREAGLDRVVAGGRTPLR